MKDDKYMSILAIYVNSKFQLSEGFLRTKVGLVKDDITLVLNEHNLRSITHDLELGIHTFKDKSKALFNILQPEYELYNISGDFEYDDITMKTKLVVIPGIIAITFDEKTFLVPSSVSLHIGIINTIMITLVRKL